MPEDHTPRKGEVEEPAKKSAPHRWPSSMSMRLLLYVIGVMLWLAIVAPLIGFLAGVIVSHVVAWFESGRSLVNYGS